MSDEIQKYWDDFWNKRELSGSQNDVIFQSISSDAVYHVLPKCENLLIIGCGDGYGIEKYKLKATNVVGIDFSESSIKKAKEKFPDVKFIVGNILDVHFKPETFDAIISERCICNLPTKEDQSKVLDILYSYLKIDGVFILCEPWLQGYDRIDKIRESLHLPPLKRHWHNILIDDYIIKTSYFDIKKRYTFGVYTLISRLFHPLYCYPEEPKFNSKINQLGASINNATMFLDDDINALPSQHVLYVLEWGH